MTAQALQSIRVVELARDVPAAWCGRQFALWGAEVVALELPGGSPLRRRAPVAAGTSLLWTYVAAGKRSAAVPHGRAALLDLLGRADVFVTDASDGELASWGLTLAEVHAALPGLVVVSTPAFGHDGPFAGLAGGDLVLQALSGYLSLNGAPGRTPLKAPGHILAYMTGVSAFVAALAALVGRFDGGGGRLVEAGQFQALSAILPFLKGQYSGDPPVREGGPSTGVRIYACADGQYISLIPPQRNRGRTMRRFWASTPATGQTSKACGVRPSWTPSARSSASASPACRPSQRCSPSCSAAWSADASPRLARSCPIRIWRRGAFSRGSTTNGLAPCSSPDLQPGSRGPRPPRLSRPPPSRLLWTVWGGTRGHSSRRTRPPSHGDRLPR